MSARKNPSDTVDLLHAIEHLKDPKSRARLVVEQCFVRERIFSGLKAKHPTFDSPDIPHFNANDFRIVVERCSLHGVLINGVEVFTEAGRLLDIRFPQDEPDSWCIDLIEEYRSKPKVSFCASYSVPG